MTIQAVEITLDDISPGDLVIAASTSQNGGVTAPLTLQLGVILRAATPAEVAANSLTGDYYWCVAPAAPGPLVVEAGYADPALIAATQLVSVFKAAKSVGFLFPASWPLQA